MLIPCSDTNCVHPACWDKRLQTKGLGMERGHNSSRLIYGHDYNRVGDGSTFDDVKLHTTTPRLRKPCSVCGSSFVARRADAVTCSSKCRDTSRNKKNPFRRHRKRATDIPTISER